ncbi:non-homologous end-joining DNA ligase [Paenibacillus protaetiae]|uniref:DNA polymerase domain-containing protein n=1 Tax=Paenibacillus protaetiae TaxID=2509456 RepID=A0A4P6EYH3_9BACL|nr:non-homologous end-joining DNA ligase [Paenibacillus protaetiae]QAY68152.1 DNA polymerase domain-containing protein [Paenibacillus protaetiae]
MSAAAKRPTATLAVGGVEIALSNPDKLLWPKEGITKLLYVQKLAALSPYLLRHCANRYLTTIRYPDGITGKSFYQKSCPQPRPDYVHTMANEGIDYVHLNSLAALMWLGNRASLEFHISFEQTDNPDYPSEWVLDLDPFRDEEPRIMEAASIVGELLESLHIKSIPKTSGATGVQIIVPLNRQLTFEQLRAAGQFIGEYLSKAHPRLFTVERFVKNRGDLIYVDYLQHYRGKSIAAPYTPRAREGAPVSTPLTWDEVRRGCTPKQFHLLNIEQRLLEKGDLLAGSLPPQNVGTIISFINKRP